MFNKNMLSCFLMTATLTAAATQYTVTVESDSATWNPAQPESLVSGDTVSVSGSGQISLTIPAGVTVDADAGGGTLSFKKLSNEGTFNVNGGTCTLEASAQTVKGTVTVKKGATLRSLSGDAIPYDNGGATINVYGALDMGSTRWTVGGSSVINLYGGCTVTGVRTGYGSLDLFRSGNVMTVQRGEDEDQSITGVTIDAKIRVRNNGSKISIAEGMTLEITGGIGYEWPNGNIVTIDGKGKLSGSVQLQGAQVNLGTTYDQVAHFVAMESTTSTLKWNVDHNQHINQICTNDSHDDPFVEIKKDATFKIDGRDFSGWQGSMDDHCWVRNNGTLVFAAGDGTRFWRGHIVLGDGSSMKIDNSNMSALLMYGGAGSVDACQLMLPSGQATIEVGTPGDRAVLYFGFDGSGGYGTKGTGFSIGDGATLTVSAPIGGKDAIEKHGEGTLCFSNANSSYSGTITLNGGTIKSAVKLNSQIKSGKLGFRVAVEKEGDVHVYRLAAYRSIPAEVAALLGGAAGGDEIRKIDNEDGSVDLVHVFRTVGESALTIPENNNIKSGTTRILVVGGGGGGGGDCGGGGGAGGLVFKESLDAVVGTVKITVGNGGAGGSNNSNGGLNRGVNGGDSSVQLGASCYTALGGGGGGGWGNPNGLAGLAGGSGGGSGGTAGRGDATQPTSASGGFGYAGGLGVGSNRGGGGGGAGSEGKDAVENKSGDGGDGRSYDISGATEVYAAGGGAARLDSSMGASAEAGIGGSGGVGGNGQTSTSAPTSGRANSGSGGGGGKNGSAGASGSAGIVIVRYTLNNATPVAKIAEEPWASLKAAVLVANGCADEVWVTLVQPSSDAIELTENVTLDLTLQSAKYTGGVTGSGKIKYANFSFVTAETKNSLKNSAWTGTLLIEGSNNIVASALDGTTANTKLNDFGNEGSKIELKDCIPNGTSAIYFGLSSGGGPIRYQARNRDHGHGEVEQRLFA